MFGAYDDSPGCPNLVSQYRNLLHHHVHMTGPREPTIFWTGCGAVRQKAFDRIGGFDATLRMMEDVEFGHRLVDSGGRIRLDPALQAKHLKCWSVASMIRMDIFDRAIPWSRLMLFDGGIESEFNLSASHRLSAITVLFILMALLMAVGWPRCYGRPSGLHWSSPSASSPSTSRCSG
jgi:GT2 family glycosyltransferase